MAFVTGLLLIDTPASALNNLGNIPGERVDNTAGVKVIRTREGFTFPYVSAQAFRYWMRATAEKYVKNWRKAPIYREDKIAYTDSNPLEWWDDDLLGYMRAPKKSKEQGKVETITRISPFRMSTLISITPANITRDFGVMSRHDGDPVPYEHQLYHTTLKGLFSLDLAACGTFSYRHKSGYRNLDEMRIKQAQEQQLEHLEDEKAYRLPLQERVRRIQGLFEALSLLEGGAKQAIHYTDVTPPLCLFAVTRGGNHIFGHLIGAKEGHPYIKQAAFHEALTTLGGDILSPIYVGWTRGYLDGEREEFEEQVAQYTDHTIIIKHPRSVYNDFIADLAKPEHAHWLQ